MDILTKSERSKRMSLIRSKWTKPERLIHNHLMAHKVRHKMHPDLPGSPDISLTDTDIVIFLHGCFWHRCSKHYKAPVNNAQFWKDKITANVARDKRNIKLLRKAGWKVRVIWEHSVSPQKVLGLRGLQGA